MNIGFIGAGKAGCSLARYFEYHKFSISGFYNRTPREILFPLAASIPELVSKSDLLFLTVTDTAISSVWHCIKTLPLQGKIICHCSGALSSDIFSDRTKTGASCASMHPMLAFDSTAVSFSKLSEAFFTIEGDTDAINTLAMLLEKCSNTYKIIDGTKKVQYHAAAVFASNFVNSVCSVGASLLTECGFSKKEAQSALAPLMFANMENMIKHGFQESLTGPVERGDGITIKKHLSVLDSDTRMLYSALLKPILKTAKEKHPSRDFSSIEQIERDIQKEYAKKNNEPRCS